MAAGSGVAVASVGQSMTFGTSVTCWVALLSAKQLEAAYFEAPGVLDSLGRTSGRLDQVGRDRSGGNAFAGEGSVRLVACRWQSTLALHVSDITKTTHCHWDPVAVVRRGEEIPFGVA